MAPAQDNSNTDHTLMLALACGATVEGAARKAGVSERTVYRRLEQPGFRRELNELRAGMHERAMGMLTATALESVKTLLALQGCEIPSAVRLGAAKAALDFGLKLRQMVELEGRLAAIEDRLADRKRN